MRHCLTLDLKSDAAAIEAYDRYHGDVWPEVLVHLRDSGIHDMTIWRRGTRLMMLIETAPDFQPDRLVVTADSSPRVKEWEQLMATFQQALADAQGAGLWQPMSEVFNLQTQLGKERAAR
ncbi:L-rhamnose mutarotase [Paraburkholderia sp. DHOC27]|nr:L-rhamnose mutarotase [Paraburkholderia sp. DHOC27]